MGFLNDEYHKTGDDLQELFKKLSDMQEHTHCEEKPLNSLKLLSHQKFGNEDVLIELDPKRPYKKNKKSITMKMIPFDRNYLSSQGYGEDEIKQALNTGLFLGSIKNPDKMIPISDLAIGSISQRTKLAGQNFFKKSLSRDLSISENFKTKEHVNIIRREEDGVSKIFAIMSDDYSEIPQRLIKDLIELIKTNSGDFGEPKCVRWDITHEISRIFLDFPKMTKEYEDIYNVKNVIPGVVIETSDIGNCSFRIRGYFRYKNTISYIPEGCRQIHAGSIDLDQLVSEAYKNIFPKFNFYPERLAELMMVDITTDEMSYEEKLDRLNEICEDILVYTGIKKILGRKRMKELNDYLVESFYITKLVSEEEESPNVTAYEIADLFLTLPGRIENIPETVKEKIAEVSVKVLNFDFGMSMLDFYVA